MEPKSIYVSLADHDHGHRGVCLIRKREEQTRELLWGRWRRRREVMPPPVANRGRNNSKHHGWSERGRRGKRHGRSDESQHGRQGRDGQLASRDGAIVF